MELQWNLCPFCGNQHVDLYHAGPPLVGEELFEPAVETPLVPSTNHKKGRNEQPEPEAEEEEAPETAEPESE
jgi:hypothetical protein